MNNSMKIDIKNRIENLNIGPSDLWLPMFEAVVNSIHAIKEKKSTEQGYILIKIERKKSLFFNETSEVNNIEIIDNGIGFTQKNYEAFLTSDTSNKYYINGKGIGRLSWPKVFELSTIESTYLENNKFFKRIFKFNKTGVIETSNKEKIKNDNTYETKIRLSGMFEKFSKNSTISLNEIAEALMNHISLYLINDLDIKIILQENKQKINITNDFFKKIIYKEEKEDFLIGNNKFIINHIFSTSKMEKKSNMVYFCAQKRVVKGYELDEFLPETYAIDGKVLYYICYVKSDFLDEDVSSERLDFNTFIYEKNKDESLVEVNGYEKVNLCVNSYLEKYIEENKKIIEKQIFDYISNERPIFLYFYRNTIGRDKIKKISYKIAFDKKKLYETLVNIDNEIYHEIEKNIKEGTISNNDIDEILSTISDTSKSSLAAYVIRRKLLIEFLDSKLCEKEGKKTKEEAIHEILFPMKKDLCSIDYFDHNLWIIDERLSYSYMGFSDKKISKINGSKDEKRPDMIFFNSFTVKEDLGNTVIDSITIVEIKRPGRKNYDEENPYEQILTYIKSLKKNNIAKGADGKEYNLSENVIFNCYILADLTRNMKEKLEDLNFIPVSKGEKYVIYNIAYNAYFEFSSYNKLIQDSKKRNNIFFKKLGL